METINLSTENSETANLYVTNYGDLLWDTDFDPAIETAVKKVIVDGWYPGPEDEWLRTIANKLGL